MPNTAERDGTLRWVEISDFRPGIISAKRQSGTAGTAVPAPLGAAQLSGTFRCVALPSGGLAPLPKIQSTYSIPLPDTDANTKFGYFNVNGFTAFGPVGPGPAGDVDDFFLMIEYVLNAAPNNRTVTYYRVDPVSGTDPYPSDQLQQLTSTQSQNNEQYIGTSFAISRMSNTGPNFTNPGTPVVVANWAPPGFAANPHIWAFPSPAAPAVTATVELTSTRPTAGGETNVGDILGHQGRVVMLEYLTNQFGARAGDSIPTNEQISYTDPANSYNAFTTYSIGTQQSVFGPEYPNGYGAWGSISAGELFLVKHQGGACRVLGDLNTPTVTRLYGVTGTGGFGNRAASAPVGFVYYSRFLGAWLWRGADTSERISTQLEDDFMLYTPGNDKLLNVHVQLEPWGDWIVTTNGYLWDSKQGGWWRLDDPTSYVPQWFARGFFGDNLYAVPLRAVNLAGQPGSKAGFIRKYNMRTAANSFSWQSHPIPVTRDRLVDVRDMVLSAQGNGTVTVTLTSTSGTVTETFTVSNQSQPQRLRPAASTAAGQTTGTYESGYNCVAQIVSTGSGGGAAPTVHSLALGWRDSISASGS